MAAAQRIHRPFRIPSGHPGVVGQRGKAVALLLPPLLLALGGLAAAAGLESSDWYAEVSRQIQASEYHLSLDGATGAFTAPNRAHGLRGTWREGRLELSPREDAAAWRFTFQLTALGRLGAVAPASDLAVGGERVEAGRIEWPRGDLREWYRNDGRGIEQGFDLERRPEGEQSMPVFLEAAIDGLLAYPADDGQSILLRTAAGQDALRIRDLFVRDDRGSEVGACFEVATGALRILIADGEAVYPLHVDPLLTSPAWTAESNQASSGFGISSTAGDVNGDGYSDVIVGAQSYDLAGTNSGAAFVYHGSASGLPTSPAWTAGCSHDNCLFGRAVGTAGDVNGDGYSDVIVGALWWDNGEDNEGRALVYHGSASGLAANPAWTVEGNQLSPDFGNRVATAGDVNGDGYADVIVGAGLYDNGQTDEGKVWVYHGSSTGLSPTANWTKESDQVGAELGWGAATAGDVNGDGYADVVVGALYFDNGQTDEGRAWVYHGSASGLAATAAWTGEADLANASYTYAAGTAGDVNGDGYADLLVGAPRYDNVKGRAYLYYGSAVGLAAAAGWTADSDQVDPPIGVGSEFGVFAASAGDVNGDGFADVIVGAEALDNGQQDEGRVYLFPGSAAGLATTPTWRVDGDLANVYLGSSAATAGDVNGDGYSDVIVAAGGFDNGQVDEGRVFVYHGSASGLQAAAGWTAESQENGAQLGTAVATAGDVNGDGYSDVVVGAFRFDNGQTDEGRAFVYHGSASGLAAVASWTAESDQASSEFGWSAATAGDVNGDGYADLIVGAPTFANGQAAEGKCFVYLGSASGLAAAPAWTAESDQANASLGISVGTAGDVNGDGYADVVVGAAFFDNGQTDEGRAYVYHGSAAGLAVTPAWSAESNQASALLGFGVATAGDVNRDGYSDVIVGAAFFDNGQTDEGRASVYHGSAAGLAAAVAWTMETDQAGAIVASVATAGDVNGDGYADVVVGSHAYDNGETDEGRAFLFQGSASGLGAAPVWTAESGQASASFGIAVGTAGDVNGDGYSDVVVGAHFFDNDQANEGRVFVYHGAASGLAAAPAWTAESDQDDAASGILFGQSAATAGDVNGDGYSDVVVGARKFDNGQTDEGRAFLYYGNAGDGLDRIPRQARASGAAPIALLGSTTSASTSFRVRALGRSPFGRGKVRLELEVKPLGTSFDGSALQTTAYTDTGAPGGGGSQVGLDHPTTPLPVPGAFHWRARLRTRAPYPWQTQWMSPQGNGPNESDLRRGPTEKPDLTVSLITAPAVSGEGKTIVVKDTTKNLGPGPADPSTTELYLSLNNKWDAGDTFLATRSVDALGPLGTSLGTHSVTIPGGWPTGTSYLIGKADAASVVVEAKETNNTKAKSIKIGPDLQETKVVAPASAAKGSTFVLTDTAKNAGGASCGPSTTKLYLSVNNKYEASDVLLGSRSVGALAAGATSVASTSVTIPGATSPGAYFLLARADGDLVVVESAETNNVKAKAITITN